MQDAKTYTLTDKSAPWAGGEQFDAVESFDSELLFAICDEVLPDADEVATIFVSASIAFERVGRTFGPFRVSNDIEPTSAQLVVLVGPEAHTEQSLFRVATISKELDARIGDAILDIKAAEDFDPIAEARFDRAVARARSLSFE